MPLREGLLTPISTSKPSGENLRYSALFEKIKEELRTEDIAPHGDPNYRLKEANYRSVIQLTGDALANESKDLQLAAWLTEALIHQEGFPGLTECLDLLRALIEEFWETLHPEEEDGDLELRAVPLRMVGEGHDYDKALRMIPLTESGFDWFAYKQARSVPSEEDGVLSESKLAARLEAIAEGKVTPEAFDSAVSRTPSEFYKAVMADCGIALGALERLNQVCKAKFDKASPSFLPLRNTLEDIQHAASILLEEKGQGSLPPESPPPQDEDIAPTTPVAPPKIPPRVVSSEPADHEDAIKRIVDVARYLRREDRYSPAPYLILRGLRWGELLASSTPDTNLLEAPGSEIRQEIRRLSLEGQWEQLLDAAENVMGSGAGRAWLDLQRHVVRACTELGSYYEPIAAAIRSELRVLLATIPSLPQMTLKDDTPAANPETLGWLREIVVPPASPEDPAEDHLENAATPLKPQKAEEPKADVREVAMNFARAGKIERALETLDSEIIQDRSGRGEFRRRFQIAQVFMASRKESIAYPILQELWKEIEARRLDEWETAEMLAEPLSLLYLCMEKVKTSPEEKQRVFGQICRLDPIQAARLAK